LVKMFKRRRGREGRRRMEMLTDDVGNDYTRA
jgi:hypothetical protein